MAVVRRWVVPTTKSRLRLDRFLALELPAHSRSQIQAWIRSGDVLLNGSRSKTGQLLHAGDEIVASESAQAPDLPQPEPIPLHVIYEDEDLAVIDKPAGLVCHAGAGRKSGTLVNAVLHRWGRVEAGDPMRPGIVHRLDKQTSGVMVIARTESAARSLGRQFKDREVRKEYFALVYGKVAQPEGTVDAPLGRDPVDRKKISVRARRRRAAVTRYKLVEYVGPCSLLIVHPETGRTHQIRVHLASLGHPVVGDTVYGGGRSLSGELQPLVSGLGRFFLHAHRLEFRHPRTDAALVFSTCLPAELVQLLNEIRRLCGRKERSVSTGN
jgi:23S rRNA pseudouridine1911/1915/1917 synthase